MCVCLCTCPSAPVIKRNASFFFFFLSNSNKTALLFRSYGSGACVPSPCTSAARAFQCLSLLCFSQSLRLFFFFIFHTDTQLALTKAPLLARRGEVECVVVNTEPVKLISTTSMWCSVGERHRHVIGNRSLLLSLFPSLWCSLPTRAPEITHTHRGAQADFHNDQEIKIQQQH